MKIFKSKASIVLFIVILHLMFFIIALNYNGIYTLDSPEYLISADNIGHL